MFTRLSSDAGLLTSKSSELIFRRERRTCGREGGGSRRGGPRSRGSTQAELAARGTELHVVEGDHAARVPEEDHDRHQVDPEQPPVAPRGNVVDDHLVLH